MRPGPDRASPAAGICDNPVGSKVCDSAGQVIAAPFEWLAYAMGETAAWLYEQVWAIFDSTTLVDVTAPGYVAVYNLMFGIGVMLALLMFFLQLLTGLVRRDPAALKRAASGLARAILGSFVVITLTAAALEIVDRLCVGIVHATGNSMDDMGGRITALIVGIAAINVGAPAVGTILTIFLAALAISAAVMVWFSLLIRKALLLVAIVLAPVVLSGQGWDATRGWFAKWAAFVLALICSKLVLTVIFLVAATQASAPIDFDLASISEPVTGIVLMFIAAFAPYMTYKFLSFAGVDTYHAITAEQEAKGSLNRPLPIPTSPKPNAVPGILHAANATGQSAGAPVPGAASSPAADVSPSSEARGQSPASGPQTAAGTQGTAASPTATATGQGGTAAPAAAAAVAAPALGERIGHSASTATDHADGDHTPRPADQISPPSGSETPPRLSADARPPSPVEGAPPAPPPTGHDNESGDRGNP